MTKLNKPSKVKPTQETLQMINTEIEKVLEGKTIFFNNFIDDLFFSYMS